MKFSIIIPSWNGQDLLQKNLPKVLEAVGKENEVIVVDNGSTDNSLRLLNQFQGKSRFLRLIALSKNFGFAYACNMGVQKAKGEIVVLLNNDVIPEKNFLKPLKKDFADFRVFAVSLHEPQYSWAQGKFEKGFLVHQPGLKTAKRHFSLWASGGSAAFRRKTWLKLGGFDLLFQPFYWEDLDLSYRAWKRGYQIFWEPASIVYHRHESTVSRFSKNYINLISQRNELFFIWKNITSRKLIKEHQKYLVKRLMKNPGYLKVLLVASLKLPQILIRRQKEKQAEKVKDESIFSHFE